MRKLPCTFIVCMMMIFSAQAQNDAEAEAELQKNKTPFSEPRYTFFKKTLLIFNEYLDTDSGSFNTLDVRILMPIGNKTWQLRADVPLVSANTPSINKTGFGDLSFAANYIIFLNKKQGFGVRGRVFANSANDPSFGTGKWIFAPTFLYGQFIDNEKKFLWLSNVEYQFSFAGDSDRTDISTAIFDNSLVYNFKKNWVAANITFRYNTVAEGFYNSIYLEYGRRFTPDALFYIHPSMAFGEAKLYNYGMEVGLLIFY